MSNLLSSRTNIIIEEFDFKIDLIDIYNNEEAIHFEVGYII